MGDSGRVSRSDEHLSREEERRVEEETRRYFDALSPSRHSKPQRSDYSSHYLDSFAGSPQQSGVIPEFARFQRLQQRSQKLVCGGGEDTEEFVETGYYRDLNGVDKQHHTTGTGFIEVETANGKPFSFSSHPPASFSHAPCTGNPATNDWIPAPAPLDTVNSTSDKPKRSEN